MVPYLNIISSPALRQKQPTAVIMRALFLLVVVVSAAVADEAVEVGKPPVLEQQGKVARTEEKAVEAQAGQEPEMEGEGYGEGEVEAQLLVSRADAVDVGDSSAVPVAAPIYPYPYSTFYWPQVALAAPSQLERSDVKAVVPAVPYYPYAYAYPYYTYPYTPVVAVPPAPVHGPAPPVGASGYFGPWQK